MQHVFLSTTQLAHNDTADQVKLVELQSSITGLHKEKVEIREKMAAMTMEHDDLKKELQDLADSMKRQDEQKNCLVLLVILAIF